MPREHPILFSAPMVRALLEGRKTQTRRLVKPQPAKIWGSGVMLSGPKRGRFCANARFIGSGARAAMDIPCPYGVPGDRLWVRETWRPSASTPVSLLGPGLNARHLHYAADLSDYDRAEKGPWKPSIHMPRWASRLTLELTGIRVERVQDISGADAEAEGFAGEREQHEDDWPISPREQFLRTFYDLNQRAPRTDNPWVWVLEFAVAGRTA